MKLEKLAAVAEIVSSVAIVATLAYLAIQSRQTTDLLLGESRQAAMAADLSLLTSTLNNPDPAARILGLDPQRQDEALLINLSASSGVSVVSVPKRDSGSENRRVVHDTRQWVAPIRNRVPLVGIVSKIIRRRVRGAR